jgi:hypothetical protein
MPATARLAEHHDGTKTEGHRSGGGPLERVTVNLTPRSARALELATQLTGDSKTDTINRAIQIYAYLEYIISEGGSVHTRESADSELERLKIF